MSVKQEEIDVADVDDIFISRKRDPKENGQIPAGANHGPYFE